MKQGAPLFSRLLAVGLLLALVLHAVGPVGAVDPSIQNPPLPFADTGSVLPREEDQQAFRPAEKIVLQVTYIGLTAGYITTRVGQQRIDGRPIYTFKMKARTAGPVEWFYRVRDRLVSYMDVRGLYSWGFDYRQQHDGERDDEFVRYYQGSGFALENGSRGETIPRYTQDVVSAVYYLRTQNFEVGENYSFPVHIGDEYYRMILDVEGVEKVATRKKGWIDAYRVVPEIRSPRKSEKARQHLKEGSSGLRIWLSKDNQKIPLKVKLPANFGSLYAYLYEYSEGGNSG